MRYDENIISVACFSVLAFYLATFELYWVLSDFYWNEVSALRNVIDLMGQKTWQINNDKGFWCRRTYVLNASNIQN